MVRTAHPIETLGIDRPAELPVDSLSGDFYRSLLDGLHDGVYFVDRDRRITYWNHGAERITGFAAKDIVGRYCWDNLLAHVDGQGCLLCQKACPLAQSMRNRVDCEAEVFLRHRDGQRVPVHIRASPIVDRSDRVIGAVETFSDNTLKLDAVETAAKLRQLAFIDPTTETGNRRHCDLRLGDELRRSRAADSTFGVVFLDIDLFKTINDRYGHEAGDAVLKTTAATLAANIRPADFLGRWGGEEFLVILTDIYPKEVREKAERLRILIASSEANSYGHRIGITVSIGATCFAPGDTVRSILARADELLYQSKAEGRNRVSFG